MEEKEISIEEIIDIIKKRRKIIAIITLSFVLISAILSFFIISPKYEASTKFFVGKASGDKEGYSQNDVLMYQTLMKTYSEAIKTNDFIERSIKEANVDLKAKDVLDKLSVVIISDTQILEVKFKSKNAKESKDLISGITREFIEISKDLVPGGNVKVLEKVRIPDKPVSPNKKINILIAFFLGLISSIGLAFLLEILDKTIKTKEQLELELEIPVIGSIPNMEDSKEGHHDNSRKRT